MFKFSQSCFSDTVHIEATWGDSYMSDNVWAMRFDPGANKVTSQEKITGDSLYYGIKLDFIDCAGQVQEIRRMGGIIITCSVNRNVGEMG